MKKLNCLGLVIVLFINHVNSAILLETHANKPYSYDKKISSSIKNCYSNDCWNCIVKRSISDQLNFTAFDMTKSGGHPDILLTGIYINKCKLPCWKLKPSQEIIPDRECINLVFVLPDNYKVEGFIELNFYIFIKKHKNHSGNTANIQILMDSKGHNKNIGPDFNIIESTENFPIVEPDDDKSELKNIIIRTSLDPKNMVPGNLLILTLDRIAPNLGSIEYDKDIYLAGITVRYEKK